jgi:Na+-driven multidrug efflux pump
LIFGLGPVPALGLAGAALATVIARATTFVVAMWVLYGREKMITFAPPPLKLVFDSWRKVLYIGLPTAGTNMILPVGAGIITRLIATYGPESVAAFGVATRIDMFALTVIMALGSVLGPFIGQNWGAHLLARVRQGVQYSQGFAVLWGAAMYLLLAILARPIASMFNDDPQVIDTIVMYLRIVPLGYGLQGLLLLSNTALNVLNKPLYAAALMVLQMFGLYIPLAYGGSYLFGLPGIFSAAATAYIIAGTAAFLWLRRVLATGEQVTAGQPRGVPVAEAGS